MARDAADRSVVRSGWVRRDGAANCSEGVRVCFFGARAHIEAGARNWPPRRACAAHTFPQYTHPHRQHVLLFTHSTQTHLQRARRQRSHQRARNKRGRAATPRARLGGRLARRHARGGRRRVCVSVWRRESARHTRKQGKLKCQHRVIAGRAYLPPSPTTPARREKRKHDQFVTHTITQHPQPSSPPPPASPVF